MRPRLTPAIADTRRAVRDALAALRAGAGSAGGSPRLVLVALSGGPDSLALAAATAFEAPRAGLRAGAVVVDHGLQDGSAEVAARAAAQAEELGLAPVLVRRVAVAARPSSPAPPERASTGPAPTDYPGPESAARAARYAALDAAAEETGAAAILLGHTLDDQAETVLLGLARGSGAASLQGMPPASGRCLRPFLGLRRATTEAACAEQGLEPWRDPQNADPAFARARVRTRLMPALEAELGPGVAEALARTAEQLREDAEALDRMVEEVAEDLVAVAADPLTEEPYPGGGVALPVTALAANPAAIRNRLIRLVVRSEFGRSLTRRHTLEVARLVTDWRGQGPLDLPGVRAAREGGFIVFTAAPSPRDAAAPPVRDGGS